MDSNGKIVLLSAAVAARIAAGEAIINPASVVKELIENSIDANATAITIEIQEGGKKYIRVTDNGTGMDKADLSLCAEKHATSKIKDINDLSSIATLGFRGEALFSIAAVSRLTISTRLRTDNVGTTMVINGGGIPSFNSIGLPDGTTVKAENLFFNLPPRRKFLKSNAVEAGRISALVKNLMIAHPEIAFKYIQNDKLIFRTLGDGNLLKVLNTIYPDDITAHLTPINQKYNYLKISGYISSSPFLYKTKNHIYHILNGRYIHSELITNAVLNGYRGRIMQSHYPFAVINLTLPYEMADINIHPSKMNVLFSNEEFIIKSITDIVKSKLEHNAPVMPVSQHASEKKEFEKTSLSIIEDKSLLNLNSHKGFSDTCDLRIASPVTSQPWEMFELPQPIKSKSFLKKDKTLIQDQTILESSDDLKGYKIIGTAFNTYIICEVNDSLYVIDQHAAHERIQYDNIKQQLENNNSICTQTLLIPLIKKVNQHEDLLIKKYMPIINKFGFEIEEFGNLTYKISGLPSGIERSLGDIAVDDILNEFKKGNKDITVLEENIIRAACHRSVKSGDNLTEPEIKTLIDNIINSKSILRCPHGRPIAIILTKSDFAKGFKRII